MVARCPARVRGAALATACLVATFLASPPDPAAALQEERGSEPHGVVRIAYPEEPRSWHPALLDEPAATDLAALWGLPLYRVDAWGQLRPGLAEHATVVADGARADGWSVDIRLREGEWSDGRPVVAGDVVATIEALREVRGDELAVLVASEARDDRTVRLTFDRPYARWPYLLAGAASVLPAHLVEADGLDAYREELPVTGGWFRRERLDRGLRAVFAAAPGGPLGAPGLERVEVYFTPSYETALGLLRDRRVDVVAGHLAVNPVVRAGRVEGVVADAPLGGTWAGLEWWGEGALGGDHAGRVVARDAIDLQRFVEGLLGRYGAPMSSTVPGRDGPWRQPASPAGGPLEGLVATLLLPADEEATAFTGRLLQGSLEARDATVELARVDSHWLYEAAGQEGDGAVLVRRDLPWPSFTRFANPAVDGRALRRADADATVDGPEVEQAEKLVFEAAWLTPLYRVATAHAWHRDLEHVRASSWPGIALWDVGRWRWGPEGPPQQQPAVGRER